jgi:DNA modification methylase
MAKIILRFGDCLERMKDIPDQSVDLVLTDPPYGTTACKWDAVIPIEPMWEQLKRVIKMNGAICLFGVEPFSSVLRVSNLKMFKYDWCWRKDRPSNHLNAKKQPMRRNEIISVFYKTQCCYIPQLTKKDPKNIRPPTTKRPQAEHYGAMAKESVREIPTYMMYPDENLYFNSCRVKGEGSHPTEKPVDLLGHLIKTYTEVGETVLDFAMGSGSTGVAALNLRRRFIGIEKDPKYYRRAKRRILATR